jgi:hypothetical protein
MSESSIPTAMQWRFKPIRKLLKETVSMTPNNLELMQQDVQPTLLLLLVGHLLMKLAEHDLLLQLLEPLQLLMKD